MKSSFAFTFLITITTTLLFLLVSCDPNEIATKKSTANKKAVGRWHLVSIKSGWTGVISSPAEKIDMVIDENQQATVYKDDTEVARFQYTLEQTASETLRFMITKQSGTSPISLFSGSYFSVSSKQLILDDTFVDGPAYTFERS
jgi:hypothetical protein